MLMCDVSANAHNISSTRDFVIETVIASYVICHFIMALALSRWLMYVIRVMQPIICVQITTHSLKLSLFPDHIS